MTKETLEALLYQIVKEFDEGYFNRTGCVAGVQFEFFADDAVRVALTGSGITLGCYNSETRMINLNEFFKKPLKYGMYYKEVAGILFHELIHGVILNCKQPLRFKLFHDMKGNDYHGPEFERLESTFPGRITDEQMAFLEPKIVHWMFEKLQSEAGQ